MQLAKEVIVLVCKEWLGEDVCNLVLTAQQKCKLFEAETVSNQMTINVDVFSFLMKDQIKSYLGSCYHSGVGQGLVGELATLAKYK